jgi:hypothetical protein
MMMTQKPEHSHEERVRLKAYEIWLNEGKPEGREHRHWAMARELIGHEDAHRSTLVPETTTPGGEAQAFQSQGEAAPKASEKGVGGSKSGRSAAKPVVNSSVDAKPKTTRGRTKKS